MKLSIKSFQRFDVIFFNNNLAGYIPPEVPFGYIDEKYFTVNQWFQVGEGQFV